MTDLEMLERAKMYIEKMANGVNPLTDVVIDDDDFINNVRISRCLFYVSGVLEKVIDAGGEVSRSKVKKSAFSINSSNLAKFNYSDVPIALSVIADKINELVDTSKMKKLTYKTLASWLMLQGFLEVVSDDNRKTRKNPTAKGRNLGISTVQKTSQQGETYYVVVYNLEAQHFIVDNMTNILQQ